MSESSSQGCLETPLAYMQRWFDQTSMKVGKYPTAQFESAGVEALRRLRYMGNTHGMVSDGNLP